MKHLIVYNEKCLVVTSNKTKYLIKKDNVKCWVDDITDEKVLDVYCELRARLNYHPLVLHSNPTLFHDEYVFTTDGRNGTHLISNVKFI
jgi:hypothetical protein